MNRDPESGRPLICTVTPVHNRRALTLRFLEQMQQVTWPNLKVIIVDDGSTDGTSQAIRERFPDVSVLQGDGDLWWAGGTNRGVQHALKMGADYILTINDDAEFEPDFIDRLFAVAQTDDRAIVGSRLMQQGQRQRIRALGSSMVFRGHQMFSLNYLDRDWSDVKGAIEHPLPVPTMPGNGVLYPGRVFEIVGMFDEHHLPQYHADSDLILRAGAATFQPVIALDAVVYDNMNQAPTGGNPLRVIFSRRSDRYWKAVLTILWRHGPRGRLLWLAMMQWLPFFLPAALQKRARRKLQQQRRAQPLQEPGTATTVE